MEEGEVFAQDYGEEFEIAGEPEHAGVAIREQGVHFALVYGDVH